MDFMTSTFGLTKFFFCRSVLAHQRETTTSFVVLQTIYRDVVETGVPCQQKINGKTAVTHHKGGWSVVVCLVYVHVDIVICRLSSWQHLWTQQKQTTSMFHEPESVFIIEQRWLLNIISYRLQNTTQYITASCSVKVTVPLKTVCICL